jgi:hypothetical protein
MDVSISCDGAAAVAIAHVLPAVMLFLVPQMPAPEPHVMSGLQKEISYRIGHTMCTQRLQHLTHHLPPLTGCLQLCKLRQSP